MKRNAVLMSTFFFALLAVLSPVRAQYRFGSEEAPERSWLKVVEGLGVCLSVTLTPGQELADTWTSPVPVKKRTLIPADKVKRNQKFTVFVLFQNCKPNDTGNCDITVTYALLDSKQQVILDRKDLPVWQDPPPPLDRVELALALWGNVAFDVEPAGTYHVRAVVRDRVNGTEIRLQRPLDLVEEK